MAVQAQVEPFSHPFARTQWEPGFSAWPRPFINIVEASMGRFRSSLYRVMVIATLSAVTTRQVRAQDSAPTKDAERVRITVLTPSGMHRHFTGTVIEAN